MRKIVWSMLISSALILAGCGQQAIPDDTNLEAELEGDVIEIGRDGIATTSTIGIGAIGAGGNTTHSRTYNVYVISGNQASNVFPTVTIQNTSSTSVRWNAVVHGGYEADSSGAYAASFIKGLPDRQSYFPPPWPTIQPGAYAQIPLDVRCHRPSSNPSFVDTVLFYDQVLYVVTNQQEQATIGITIRCHFL